MANILGISGLYHDAPATLVVDGEIICALQEERLSRIKNDAALPFRAAKACLEFAKLSAQEIDQVVFYESPFDKLERVLDSSLRDFPRSALSLPRVLRSQWGGKLWVLDHLAEGLGIQRSRISNCQHHESHAMSAFACSPFSSAAVLVVDGVGERSTTSIWHGSPEGLKLIEELEFPHSLGLFYSAITAYLGFSVNEGEYKVMGLAAFGQARFMAEFEQLLQCHADGSFELGLSSFAPYGSGNVGFTPRLDELLGARRRYGAPWNFDAQGAPADAETQRFADIAASAKASLERAMLGLSERARSRTSESKLCLAGGVALNALCNSRLAQAPGVSGVFVQPAAGDAGGSLGAALIGSKSAGDPSVAPMKSAALGLPIDPAKALELARAMNLSAKIIDDPPSEAAQLIAQDKIIAWVNGRSEWGPRALGQRSLLARPDKAEHRENLNRAIKHREPFRPFAPAILRESANQYFECAPNEMTPFMTTVCPVRPTAQLDAVTHRDGSARLQTVERDTPFGALLVNLESRGLPPCVLNTSLNENGEPIILSAADALIFFQRSEIDALIIEDVIIRKNDKIAASDGSSKSEKDSKIS